MLRIMLFFPFFFLLFSLKVSEDNFTVGVDVWWFEKKKEEKTEKKNKGEKFSFRSLR